MTCLSIVLQHLGEMRYDFQGLREMIDADRHHHEPGPVEQKRRPIAIQSAEESSLLHAGTERHPRQTAEFPQEEFGRAGFLPSRLEWHALNNVKGVAGGCSTPFAALRACHRVRLGRSLALPVLQQTSKVQVHDLQQRRMLAIE